MHTHYNNKRVLEIFGGLEKSLYKREFGIFY
jgi:hypothetical protein